MYNLIASIFTLDDIVKYKSAGAHSIVVGIPFFSLRAHAYFEDEAIVEARNISKEAGLSMYVLVNALFMEDDLEALKEKMLFLKKIDVDGIYFSDEAVLYIAQGLEMEDKLIYNPDTLVTNTMDAKYYLDEGVSMITLSKEITLEDMCHIGDSLKENRCEVIIHGRLAMMHSKRSLLTNYFDHLNQSYDLMDKKSLYLIENTREDHMPVIQDEAGTHIFSGFTLAAFEEVQYLVDHKITNLRIESLFKDANYTMEALSLYRDILNHKCDAHEVYESYVDQYKADQVEKGFLHQKTSLVKEAL